MYVLFTGLLRPVFYLALLLSLLSSHVQAQAQPPLPTRSLQINDTTLLAEVADTEDTRTQGLMYRLSLAPNSGMIFVFDYALPMCFWMKSTPLPLSIAFIAEDGTITNIEAMQPLSTDSVCPLIPIKYALEMEQGWFDEQGIYAGDVVQHLPD